MSEGSSRDYRQALADIDITKPNIARVYDYFVGGKDNFSADREFARRAMELAPKAPLSAQNNRAFLRRVVRYLVGEAASPSSSTSARGCPRRATSARSRTRSTPRSTSSTSKRPGRLHAQQGAAQRPGQRRHHQRRHPRSGRDPGRSHGRAADRLRPAGRPAAARGPAPRPDDEDPDGIAARLRDAMPAGSYLAISSFRLPGHDLPELRAITIEGEKLLADGLGSGRWREDDEIRAWFGDWELLPPGLVSLAGMAPGHARPIEHDENYHSFFGGVARKR